MAKTDLPPVDTLREILHLDAENGTLRWKQRPVSFFKTHAHANAWNARYAGREAFTAKNGGGYHHGSIGGITVTAHIVIWALYYGEHTPGLIDHIDGNPSNNRPSNLRAATHGENNRNRRSARGSTSQYLGVYWDKNKSLWRAVIRLEGRPNLIGYFRDEWEAAQAYNATASKHFGEFANPNKKKTRERLAPRAGRATAINEESRYE